MCNGTNWTASLNVLLNKSNYNVFMILHVNRFSFICNPRQHMLQYYLFCNIFGVAILFVPMHINCCSSICSVAHSMLQFYLFRLPVLAYGFGQNLKQGNLGTQYHGNLRLFRVEHHVWNIRKSLFSRIHPLFCILVNWIKSFCFFCNYKTN